MSFKDLGLEKELLHSISRAGFDSPTEIQSQAIPTLIKGRDLLGISQTGTGKTAAYCLPIIQDIIQDRQKGSSRELKALIIVPTRELCLQVVESLETLSQDLKIHSCAIFGGVAQKDQVSAIREGLDVLVATPGRLLDLLSQRLIRTSSIKHFVLDEADRMLNMGFIDDIEKIIAALPETRQNIMFSATMPGPILKLAKEILIDPVKVQVSPPNTVVEKIEQKVIFCKTDHKFQLLKKIFKEDPGIYLVFTTSKTSADEVAEYLLQNRIATGAIHADRKQTERERHLKNFKDRAIKILIASDIAARGIDVEGISHVINFELPLSGETYLHRIGRTARAGKQGKAISFCDESESALLEKIKKTLKLEIPSESFQGQFEKLNLRAALAKKAKAPTPGKSQEKTAYLDHSKRQKQGEEGKAQKRAHPVFSKQRRKKKR
jgi:ATP-dependent RNA helicase RhlE